MHDDEFKPYKINKNRVAFSVEYKQCYICNCDMVNKSNDYIYWFDEQVKKAGMNIQSNIRVDDPICTKCYKEGKADFLCAMCGERKPFPSAEKFGDPPEFLCKDCYSTVPAQEWDEKVDELHGRHRYDFE